MFKFGNVFLLIIAFYSSFACASNDSWSYLSKNIAKTTGEKISTFNELQFFRDGNEYYPAYIKTILESQRTIDIQTYLWCDDEAGFNFANSLVKMAQKGVRVRVIIEATTKGQRSRVSEILERGGVYQLNFNRIMDRGINMHLHEKIMIVDGQKVLAGGANICNEYMLSPSSYTTTERGSNLPLWHDFVLAVEGQLVSDYQKKYDQNWNETADFQHGKDHMYDGFMTADFFNAYSSGNQTPRKRNHQNFGATPLAKESLTGKGSEATGLLWQRPYQSKRERKTYAKLYIELVAQTKNELVLYSPYFIPYPDLKEKLEELAKRGVVVKIFTNAPETNDMPMAASTRARLGYEDLLEAGVRIFEIKGRTQHAKAILIDNETFLIGSNNFTRRSMTKNGEQMMATNSAKVISKFKEGMVYDLKNEYREISLKNYIRPSGKLDNLWAKMFGYFI